jgi:hypothetical protein
MPFWLQHRPLLYIAVALLMVTGAHELLSFLSYYRQLSKIHHFDRNVRAILSATISQVEMASGASWRSIGVSSYCLRRFLWWKSLLLVEDLRLGGGSLRKPPRWLPRKGYIGTCFSNEESICLDWQSYFKEAAARGKTTWSSLQYDERYGLTWGELMRTEQIEWVAAFPVFAPSGKAIGVVAIDAPTDLSIPAIEPVLRDVGAALGDVGKPPGSWWSYVVRRND